MFNYHEIKAVEQTLPQMILLNVVIVSCLIVRLVAGNVIRCHDFISSFFFLRWFLANWIELINGNLLLWQALEECETLGTPPTEQSRIELEFRIEEAKENIRKAEVMCAACLSPFTHFCDVQRFFFLVTPKEKDSRMFTPLLHYSKRWYISSHKAIRSLIVHELDSLRLYLGKGKSEKKADVLSNNVPNVSHSPSVMNAFPFPDRDAFSLSLLICSETGCQSLCLINMSSPLRCPAVSLHMTSSSRGALCWPSLWPLLYVKAIVHIKMIIVSWFNHPHVALNSNDDFIHDEEMYFPCTVSIQWPRDVKLKNSQ